MHRKLETTCELANREVQLEILPEMKKSKKGDHLTLIGALLVPPHGGAYLQRRRRRRRSPMRAGQWGVHRPPRWEANEHGPEGGPMICDIGLLGP